MLQNIVQLSNRKIYYPVVITQPFPGHQLKSHINYTLKLYQRLFCNGLVVPEETLENSPCIIVDHSERNQYVFTYVSR